MVGFRDLVWTGIAPVSTKTAVKTLMLKQTLVLDPLQKREQGD